MAPILNPKENTRLLYNKAILTKLTQLVNDCPTMRFQQLLWNMDIITNCNTSKDVAEDRFYEESEDTWKRMVNNPFCFPKD